MGGEVMTTMTERKRPEPKPKFQAGDRVKEVRKFQHNVTNPFNRKTDRIKKCLEIAANQRVGTVIRTFLKPNQNGARHVYVEVLWDGFKTPSEHLQIRLAPLDSPPED